MVKNMRTDEKRAKKYEKKLVGNIAKERTDSYRKEQIKHFKFAVEEQVKIEHEVKNMIKSRLLIYYIIFGKQVVKLRKKYQGNLLFNELEILQNLWFGRGLDFELLNKIKHYYVPSWPIISFFTMDHSLLDGPDVLS